MSPSVDSSRQLSFTIQCTCDCCRHLTFQSAVKVRVGGHLEARVWQQEAADVGEAGVNVLPHVLQLFVLVLFHLRQQNVAFPLVTVHVAVRTDWCERLTHVLEQNYFFLHRLHWASIFLRVCCV